MVQVLLDFCLLWILDMRRVHSLKHLFFEVLEKARRTWTRARGSEVTVDPPAHKTKKLVNWRTKGPRESEAKFMKMWTLWNRAFQGHYSVLLVWFWPELKCLSQISKIIIHVAVEQHWVLPEECLEWNNTEVLHSTLYSELSDVGGFVEKL